MCIRVFFRHYITFLQAYWEVYDDLCEKVKEKHPYNEGRRLLDVLDMSVFDFLTGVSFYLFAHLFICLVSSFVALI